MKELVSTGLLVSKMSFTGQPRPMSPPSVAPHEAYVCKELSQSSGLGILQ